MFRRPGWLVQHCLPPGAVESTAGKCGHERSLRPLHRNPVKSSCPDTVSWIEQEFAQIAEPGFHPKLCGLCDLLSKDFDCGVRPPASTIYRIRSTHNRFVLPAVRIFAQHTNCWGTRGSRGNDWQQTIRLLCHLRYLMFEKQLVVVEGRAKNSVFSVAVYLR